MNTEELRRQAAAAAEELCAEAGLSAGDIMVIGCSTSEICGEKIGTASVPEAAEAVFEGIRSVLSAKGIYIAAQCCEHLNRAIVVEKAAVPGAETVCAVPKPKAGGSFAAAAYLRLSEPVLVEEIRADAGMDIGSTLIGMHLKKVAVPVRLKNNIIGEAHITAARTRPKYIGGPRTQYE